MAFKFNLKRYILRGLSKIHRGLSILDHRHRWIKYLVVVILASTSLFFGQYTIIDYVKLEERKQMLESEIDKLEPKLQEDSVKLDELKHLGRGTEAIAREKYLMKSPGEQIFLLTPDSTTKQ